MGYSILTPTNSFVRFDSEAAVQHCIHGTFATCLPVYANDDVAFQFVIEADTSEEAAALCQPGDSGIQIGLVRDCDQEAFDVEFNENPERYRISDLQILFNWPHGMPGMTGEMQVGECFYIRIIVGEEDPFCSNCFNRISDNCFTSVVDYTNEDDFAGFNYCNGEAVDGGGGEGITCEPEIITFTNESLITIPYTTSMQDKYGEVPTIQVWIYDEAGNLVNMGVVAVFDAMPPTLITVNPGGPSSGIIVIR